MGARFEIIILPPTFLKTSATIDVAKKCKLVPRVILTFFRLSLIAKQCAGDEAEKMFSLELEQIF